MTATTLHSAHGLGDTNRGFTATLIQPFKRAYAALSRYRKYRQTVNEMTGCSDRVLNDLGIYRSEIRWLARETAYGSKS